MNLAGLVHLNTAPWASPVGADALRLVLWAAAGDLQGVTVHCSDRYSWPPETHEQATQLQREAGDGARDYWACTVHEPSGRFRYRFELLGSDGQVLHLGEDGPHSTWQTTNRYFQVPFLQPSDTLRLPQWLNGAVFYQIFPDRFADGDPGNNPPGTLPWGSPPQNQWTFMGGDLAGIRQNLHWLRQLHVRGLYLTPIFKSSTNHKYNTFDYMQIDPSFGSKADLQGLVQDLHAGGMRLLLDAVFNHSGVEFFAFKDLLKRGEASRYKDWFFPLSYPVDLQLVNYVTYAIRAAYMPKLNLDNPATAAYFVRVATHWLREAGIDGWRMDVGNEVPLHFWRRLRQAVKAANPDALLLGETFHESLDYLRGDTWDSVMHYPWQIATLDFLSDATDVAEYDARATRLRYAYSRQAVPGLLHLLGSHDKPRVRTYLKGRQRADLGAVLLLTSPGVPMIYYGDEVGMEGGEDPGCRGGMEWDPARQDLATLALYRRLTAIRSRLPWLNQPEWETLRAEHGLYAYRRWDAATGGAVQVALNRTPKEQRVTLPAAAAHVDLLSGQVHRCHGRTLTLTLPPWGAAVLADAAAAAAVGATQLPPM